MEAGFTGRYPREAFAELVASPDDRLPTWIASEQTVVLVVATDVTSTCYGALDRSTARIRALYTAPAYQGEGHATVVLDRFERLARRAGLDRLEATVPLNAVGFFERRGFTSRGPAERAGLEMVEVEKPLT